MSSRDCSTANSLKSMPSASTPRSCIASTSSPIAQPASRGLRMEVLDQTVGDRARRSQPVRAVLVGDLSLRVVLVVIGAVIGRHRPLAGVALLRSARLLIAPPDPLRSPPRRMLAPRVRPDIPRHGFAHLVRIRFRSDSLVAGWSAHPRGGDGSLARGRPVRRVPGGQIRRRPAHGVWRRHRRRLPGDRVRRAAGALPVPPAWPSRQRHRRRGRCGGASRSPGDPGESTAATTTRTGIDRTPLDHRGRDGAGSCSGRRTATRIAPPASTGAPTATDPIFRGHPSRSPGRASWSRPDRRAGGPPPPRWRRGAGALAGTRRDSLTGVRPLASLPRPAAPYPRPRFIPRKHRCSISR